MVDVRSEAGSMPPTDPNRRHEAIHGKPKDEADVAEVAAPALPGQDPLSGGDPPQAGIDGVSLPALLRDIFRLDGFLGEGSFGRVWLAHDRKLDRPVALKSLRIPPGSGAGPRALAALERDARSLAKVEHPNIVRVYGWHAAGDEHFLAMQYVAGGTLASRLEREVRIAWPDAVQHVADVGEALLAVHECGIIHRDIKPANILWDEVREEPMLTDFGLSSHLSEPGSSSGTPHYMAPESWDRQVSPGLDVFSLAVTLYHLITGDLPFPDRDRAERLVHIRRGLTDPDPRLREIPEFLERTLRAGMEADPGRRPGLKDFLDGLRGELNGSFADALAPPVAAATAAPVRLQVRLSLEEAPDSYRLLPTSPPHPLRLSRGMRKGAGPAGEVRLRTGDRVRVEVVADRPGHLIVFNVGPDGELNLLYPDSPSAPPLHVDAHRPIRIDDVTMTPPRGRERLFAFWTRRPTPFRPDDLKRLAVQDEAPVSEAYRSTRGMKKMHHALQQLPPDDWHAVVLELDHVE